MGVQFLDPSFFSQMEPAEREPLDPRTLRSAFGCFATGVAVVTAESPSGLRAAVTINSFSSVSLEPPLLLLCLNRRSRSLDVLQDARRLAVQFLRADQKELAAKFAQSGDDKLEGVNWSYTPRGVLRLESALAVFDCDLRQFVPGGDHRIVLAEVADVEVAADDDAEPLMFFRGRYYPAGE